MCDSVVMRIWSWALFVVVAGVGVGCDSDIGSEAPPDGESEYREGEDTGESPPVEDTGADTGKVAEDTAATDTVDTAAEDGDADTAGDADGGAGDADTGSDGGTDEQVVRFIVMGDTGEGDQEQKAVAAGAQSRCDELGGCHGLLIPGDLIYDNGPESASSSELTNKVDKPYRELKYGAPPADSESDERRRMPVYAAMGNHDIGDEDLRNLPIRDEKIDYYLEYAKQHEWFVFPSKIWDKKIEFVHVMAANTNPFVYLGEPKQAHNEMIDRVVNQTDAKWTVMFGHHTYRSDGEHGNAGAYEIPWDVSDFGFLGLDLDDAKLSGGEFRDWFNDKVCGRVDFYLAGHEHNLQWMGKKEKLGASGTCDTHLGVSGAGAKHDPVVDKGNDPAFAKGKTRGFVLVGFRPERAHVEVCDKQGQVLWETTIRR